MRFIRCNPTNSTPHVYDNVPVQWNLSIPNTLVNLKLS